jgi:hypothetical protein
VSDARTAAVLVLTTFLLDTQRVGHVVFDKSNSFDRSYGLRVIQGEVPTRQQGLPSWPSGVPPADCVILCYDSSRRSTYEPIEGLLSKKTSFERL